MSERIDSIEGVLRVLDAAADAHREAGQWARQAEAEQAHAYLATLAEQAKPFGWLVPCFRQDGSPTSFFGEDRKYGTWPEAMPLYTHPAPDAGLRARLEGLVEKWNRFTAETREECPRPYENGQAFRSERCAEELRAILATPQGEPR
jgi:hypothetical protein